MKHSLQLLLSIMLLTAIGCKNPESSSKLSNQNANESIVDRETTIIDDNDESACPVTIPGCSLNETRRSQIDENGCEHITCEATGSEREEDEENTDEGDEHQIPDEPNDPNPEPDEPSDDNSVCNYNAPDGTRRELRPQDGYINRYVPIISSSYYPIKGRYANGVSMYCEKHVIQCSHGKIRGRRTQARLLVNRNKSRCTAQIFIGHPEYSYSTYKELYLFFADKYDFCHKREPSPIEVREAIDAVIEDGKHKYEVASDICNYKG